MSKLLSELGVSEFLRETMHLPGLPQRGQWYLKKGFVPAPRKITPYDYFMLLVSKFTRDRRVKLDAEWRAAGVHQYNIVFKGKRKNKHLEGHESAIYVMNLNDALVNGIQYSELCTFLSVFDLPDDKAFYQLPLGIPF